MEVLFLKEKKNYYLERKSNMNLELFYKILLCDKPSKLIKENENYFFKLIPELKKCKGFNQNNPWHIYDVYEHILHVIDDVRNDLVLRITALFHDVGKPYVYKEDNNHIGHFYNHWNKSNEIFLKFAKKYNLDKKLINQISNLIIYHDMNLDIETKELSKIIDNIGIENIELLYEIKKSDLKAQNSKYHYILDK